MKTNEKIGINLHQSHCSTVPEITALLFPNLLHFIFPKSLHFFFLFTVCNFKIIAELWLYWGRSQTAVVSGNQKSHIRITWGWWYHIPETQIPQDQ